MTKTTIKDIAKETGLSIAAISLVLNRKPNKISAASRQLILETAKRLNYYPNQLAVSLITNQSKTIGLVIPDISNIFFADMARGVDDIVHAYGYSLILGNTSNDFRRDLENIHLFLARGVDGILITTSTQSEIGQMRDLFAKIRIPIVLLDRNLPSLDRSCLTCDHEKGGYLATRHLLELGHRRIACLTGGATANSSQLRHDGFVRAFAEAGQALPKDYFFAGDYQSKSGYEMAEGIIRRGFTAVFSCNDLMAFGIYQRAREMGVRIPDGLSVVGFDDIVCSGLLDPALTTVRQTPYQLGQAAGGQILQEIDKPQTEKTIRFFEPELIIRGSTKPISIRLKPR